MHFAWSRVAMLRFIFLLLLVLTLNVQADEVFKCSDTAGNISYQNQPCSAASSKSETIEVENTPDPNYVSPTFPSATESSRSSKTEVSRARAERDRELAKSQNLLCENARKDVETYITIRDMARQSGTLNRYSAQNYELMIQGAQRNASRYCR
jgi:uncharacterized protein DUF4124